jgi:protein gp37
MLNSDIQWCDDTINPVMGCDGCELWPKSAAVRKAVVDELVRHFPDEAKTKFTMIVKNVLKDFETADLYHQRNKYIRAIDGAALKALPKGTVARSVKHVYEPLFKCYAAKVTDMRAGNKGYPETFDIAKEFEGRMAKMAKQPSLKDQKRPDKPWLDGCPRIIFVSDMGDALSEGISFEYLKQEIIDVVTSPNGSRHIWLWLTKRPERMAAFDKWLEKQGIAWPDNLVAMTSVTNQATAKRINSLRKVRAKVKGLSVEPLWEAVTLDLTGIDWIIVGGESGARDNAAPFDLVWARSLRDQCEKSGGSFFLKQLGSNVLNNGQPQKYPDTHGGSWNQWPHDLRIREVPPVFLELCRNFNANADETLTRTNDGSEGNSRDNILLPI